MSRRASCHRVGCWVKAVDASSTGSYCSKTGAENPSTKSEFLTAYAQAVATECKTNLAQLLLCVCQHEHLRHRYKGMRSAIAETFK